MAMKISDLTLIHDDIGLANLSKLTDVVAGIKSDLLQSTAVNYQAVSDRREMKAMPEHCKTMIDPTKTFYDSYFRATLDQIDMVELVPHGELVALKERDAARAEHHTLREHHDLYVSQVSETIAGLHAENLRLHDLLAQRPATFVDPDRKPERNPFRDHADDRRKLGRCNPN